MWNLILLDGLLGPITEKIPFSWLFVPRRCKYDWTDCWHRGLGRTLRHTPPNQIARAVALLLGDGACIWMDPSQIGIHSRIGSDTRNIQCDSDLVPGFVDDRGRLL